METTGARGRGPEEDRKAEILNGVFRSQSVTVGEARRKRRGAEERATPGFKAVQVRELITWKELQVREGESRSQEEVSPAHRETRKKQAPANPIQTHPASPPTTKAHGTPGKTTT